MKGNKWGLAALLLAGIGAPLSSALAVEVLKTETTSFNLTGRFQWLAVGQNVPGPNEAGDPDRNSTRWYLFGKQSRLGFQGVHKGVGFEAQLALGGEDIQASNTGMTLLDFAFDVPLGESAGLKVGQFKVPAGRERMAVSEDIRFAQRSVQDLAFVWNRDVGGALHLRKGRMAGAFAMMTGAGRDVPERYLPEKLGSPLFAARVGYDDGVDDGIFKTGRGAGREDGKLAKAFHLSALYLRDSLVGHSSTLNVRAADKSLLVNPGYNPFIAGKPLELSKVFQGGADAALRGTLGSVQVSAEAEVNYAQFENSKGGIVLRGGRVQAGVAKGKMELNVRASLIYLDPRMAFSYTGGVEPLLKADEDRYLQEVTPSISYRWKEGVVLVADMPILPNTLIYEEAALGPYLAVEQPAQISYIQPGKGRVVRRDVVEGRLMVQLTF